jgi:hypothetical protein
MLKNLLSLTLFIMLSLVVFNFQTAEAKIVEIKTMKDILSEITSDTLVLLDLDDTCVTTESMLGNSPWWEHFTRKMMTAGFDTKTTFERVFPLVGKVIQTIPLKPTESEIPFLIQSLQEQNVVVWGLTGRVKQAPYDTNFAGTTHLHLQKIGIDFEKSILPATATLSYTQPPKTFAYGIIFTNHQLKGPILKQFLQNINYSPAKVVMVDDMISHLESVERVLSDLNIPCDCFHYTRLEDAKKNFDPLIGNLQLKALLTQGYIPTDEQATLWKNEMLKLKPSLSPDFYLEELIMNIKN